MSLMSVYIVHTHTSQISTLNLQFSIFTAFTSEIPFLLTAIDKEVVRFAFSNAKTWAIFRDSPFTSSLFLFFEIPVCLEVFKLAYSSSRKYMNIYDYLIYFMYTRNVLCVMTIVPIEYEINQISLLLIRLISRQSTNHIDYQIKSNNQ